MKLRQLLLYIPFSKHEQIRSTKLYEAPLKFRWWWFKDWTLPYSLWITLLLQTKSKRKFQAKHKLYIPMQLNKSVHFTQATTVPTIHSKVKPLKFHTKLPKLLKTDSKWPHISSTQSLQNYCSQRYRSPPKYQFQKWCKPLKLHSNQALLQPSTRDFRFDQHK